MKSAKKASEDFHGNGRGYHKKLLYKHRSPGTELHPGGRMKTMDKGLKPHESPDPLNRP